MANIWGQRGCLSAMEVIRDITVLYNSSHGTSPPYSNILDSCWYTSDGRLEGFIPRFSWWLETHFEPWINISLYNWPIRQISLFPHYWWSYLFCHQLIAHINSMKTKQISSGFAGNDVFTNCALQLSCVCTHTKLYFWNDDAWELLTKCKIFHLMMHRDFWRKAPWSKLILKGSMRICNSMRCRHRHTEMPSLCHSPLCWSNCFLWSHTLGGHMTFIDTECIFELI